MNLKIYLLILGGLLIGSLSLQAQKPKTYRNLDEALKNPKQVTKLDLSRQQLKTLPGAIRQLQNLTYLDLSRNPFESFPMVIFKLKKLKVLKFDAKYTYKIKIHEIPAQIKQLKKLRYLDISNLPLHKEPRVVYQLKNLEMLKMKNVVAIVDPNKAPREPNTAGYRSSMRGAFQFTLQGIGQLKKLKELDISDNTWRMKKLSNEVTQLKNLESLNIAGSWFNTLPVGLKSMPQLKHLNLNKMVRYLKNAEINLELLAQLKLETLSMTYTDNPAVILGLLSHPQQLRSLNLSFCRLTQFPETLLRFRQLQKLNLSDNRLKDLPPSFTSLTQLEHLDISVNQFDTLPGVICKLKELKTLDCTHRFLCSPEKSLVLPDNFGVLKNLEGLNLVGHYVSKFPTSFGQLSKLKELHLHGISLQTFMLKQLAKLTNLEHLSITVSDNARFPADFENLKKLKSLSIRANYCEGVPVGNSLNQFPEVICQLTALESLLLIGHHIKTIPSSIGQLTNLRTLNLYDNLLTKLPDELGQLTQLTSLDVSLYCIAYRKDVCKKPLVLPASLCNLKKLQTLEYGDRTIEPLSLQHIKQCLKWLKK